MSHVEREYEVGFGGGEFGAGMEPCPGGYKYLGFECMRQLAEPTGKRSNMTCIP